MFEAEMGNSGRLYLKIYGEPEYYFRPDGFIVSIGHDGWNAYVTSPVELWAVNELYRRAGVDLSEHGFCYEDMEARVKAVIEADLAAGVYG